MLVQRPPKFPQFLDAGVDVLNATGQQIADLSTGGHVRPALPTSQQLLHVVECQSKRLRLFDEPHLLHRIVREEAEPALRTWRGVQQAPLFVEPERLD
jgi:hypothetical protein